MVTRTISLPPIGTRAPRTAPRMWSSSGSPRTSSDGSVSPQSPGTPFDPPGSLYPESAKDESSLLLLKLPLLPLDFFADEITSLLPSGSPRRSRPTYSHVSPEGGPTRSRTPATQQSDPLTPRTPTVDPKVGAFVLHRHGRHHTVGGIVARSFSGTPRTIDSLLEEESGSQSEQGHTSSAQGPESQMKRKLARSSMRAATRRLIIARQWLWRPSEELSTDPAYVHMPRQLFAHFHDSQGEP
jgi:hypothetical protein